MSAGTTNTMVQAVRESRTMYLLAAEGRRHRKRLARKAAGNPPPAALTREERVRRYADQTGWTSDFTPAQRRRLDHKENRAARSVKAPKGAGS